MVIQLCRQLLFLVPALWCLDKLFQLNGIWLAFPVVETATMLIALVMTVWYRHKISYNMFQVGEMMNNTFMKEKPVLPLILSMPAKIMQTSGLPRRLTFISSYPLRPACTALLQYRLLSDKSFWDT